MERYLDINLSMLTNHPRNPRKQLDIEDLTDSISESGQLMPLLVRSLGDGYQIISGHRRRVALERAGFTMAKCLVRDMDDETAFRVLMVTNIQNKSMSEIEEAEGIKRMMQEFEWTQDRIAREFGKSQDWISLRLRLLTLDPSVQDMLTTRVVKPSQARHIAKLPVEQQLAVAKKVSEQDLPTIQTEKLVNTIIDPSIADDLKRMVVENPHVTADHIEAVAKVTDEQTRKAVMNQLERNAITPTEIEQAADLDKIRARVSEGPRTVIEKKLNAEVFLHRLQEAIRKAEDELPVDMVELGYGPHALDTIDKILRRLDTIKSTLEQARRMIVERAVDSDEKVVPLWSKAH